MSHQVSDFYIYALIVPGRDIPYYVGLTINPSQRFQEHLHNPTPETLEILQAGEEPQMIILAEYSGGYSTSIDLFEQAWINQFIDAGVILSNRRQLGRVRFKQSGDNYTLMIGDFEVTPPCVG